MSPELQEALNALPGYSPGIAVVLGSGLGALVEQMTDSQSVPYESIPHFPCSTAPGHAGQLVFGKLAGVPVVVMQGRIHLYEGVSPAQIAFPIRLLKVMGVHTLILTNAAGGLNLQFNIGEIMVVTDHINLTGQNPLTGPNDDSLGGRFPDMSRVYDSDLIQLASQCALELQIPLQKGVYVGVQGPSLETPAETRFLRMMGADAVGMSTIMEAITAVHAQMRLLAFSAITNVNRPDCMAPASIDDILKSAASTGVHIAQLIQKLVQKLPERRL